MPTLEGLAQRSKELERAMQDKIKAFEADEISIDEFASARESVTKESESVGVAMKNLREAQGLAGSADPEPNGNPQEEPKQFKQYRDSFAEIKSAAQAKDRGGAMFEFGYKKFDDELGMKTQGVTGLSGEGGSGTTTPTALANGSYFLTGTAGPFIQPEFVPGVVDLRFYENVIASLIPTFATDSPVVTYVRESTWTNNAAGTWEGQTKPTSTHTFTRYAEQVGKVANLERATDEMIQDAAYIWSLIQQRCVQGVQRKEEVELLAGSGMPGVNGLLNRTAGFTAPQTVTAVTNLVVPASGTSGIGAGTDTVASVTPGRAIIGSGSGIAPTGIQIAEGVLQAITDIRVLHFFEPDAVVMNPLDYLTIRLAKDLNNQYYGGAMFGRDYGQVQSEGTPQAINTFGLWGKKVVTTPAMPQGLVLVGDFAGWNRVLRRGGLRVDITNVNGTDFEQNLWTCRAETRVGLMVERPELFELIQLQTPA
jgi:HK97 family phage major capsid protein